MTRCFYFSKNFIFTSIFVSFFDFFLRVCMHFANGCCNVTLLSDSDETRVGGGGVVVVVAVVVVVVTTIKFLLK